MWDLLHATEIVFTLSLEIRYCYFASATFSLIIEIKELILMTPFPTIISNPLKNYIHYNAFQVFLHQCTS
jgi:hypothetical protein